MGNIVVNTNMDWVEVDGERYDIETNSNNMGDNIYTVEDFEGIEGTLYMEREDGSMFDPARLR
jgi:hypothetical protein